MSYPERRGVCDTCDKEFPIRKDGTVRKHRRQGGRDSIQRQTACAGSGYPPSHIVYEGHMRSTFLARDLPEMIDIGGEMIVGPFCQHCGNPLSLHGPESHCPKQILHPVFPVPSCSCHGVQPPTVVGKNRTTFSYR